MRIYETPADHLSHRPYAVMCPEYHMRQPHEVVAGILDPIFDPFDADAEVRANKTIVALTQMVKMRTPFTILDDMDVLLMLSEIDAYYMQARALPQTEELRIFLNDLNALRDRLVGLSKRVLKKHPDWAARWNGLDNALIKAICDFIAPGQAIHTATPRQIVDNHLDSLSKPSEPAPVHHTQHVAPPPITIVPLQDQLRALHAAQNPQPQNQQVQGPPKMDLGLG